MKRGTLSGWVLILFLFALAIPAGAAEKNGSTEIEASSQKSTLPKAASANWLQTVQQNIRQMEYNITKTRRATDLSGGGRRG